MSVLGAVLEGTGGHWHTLAIKAVMDGLAAMSFVRVFGGGALLAAVPVMAWQGTITLLARSSQPWLEGAGRLDALTGTAGLLVFCLALLAMQVKKVDVADYLPSLLIAPWLVTWWT